MEDVRVLAFLTAKPGQEAAIERAMALLVEASKKEQGNLGYVMNRDLKDPLCYVIMEHWENEEVRQKHLTSDHFRLFARTVDEEHRLSEHTFKVLKPL